VVIPRCRETVRRSRGLKCRYVYSLGLEGAHSVLLSVLETRDGDRPCVAQVVEASGELIEACVKNLPAHVTFPMRGRTVGAEAAEVLSVRVGVEAAQQRSPRDLVVRLRRQREPADARQIGNMLFTSSVVLARWILAHAHKFRGRRVLELGSGLGLAGIAAARVSSECTLTDLPQFVPNLRYNIQMNADFIECGSMCTTSAQPLDWLCEDEAIDTSPRCLAGHRQPHIIIGADVVHERWMADSLCRILKRNLAPQGTAYIMNPEAKARAGVEEFCRNLLESGFQFTVDTISEASLVVGHEQECNDVRQELYVIKRIVSDGTELVTDAQHLRENETIVQT